MLLISRGETAFVERVDAIADSRIVKNDRNWFLNSEGMQMNIIRGPVEYWFGRPITDRSTPGHIHRLTQTYAVSDKTVSEIQYSHFEPKRFTTPNESAAMGITWSDAISYCDWLNAQEDIEHRASIISLDAETLKFDVSEKGYRLPSVWEWEYFARAGTTTSFSFGELDAEFSKSIFESEHRQALVFGPGLDNAIRSMVSEWTSTTFQSLSQKSRKGSIKLDDLVVIKVGNISNSKSVSPFTENKLAKPSKGYCFRLARTID